MLPEAVTVSPGSKASATIHLNLHSLKVNSDLLWTKTACFEVENSSKEHALSVEAKLDVPTVDLGQEVVLLSP